MAVVSRYNKYSVEPLAARAGLRQFGLAVHETAGVSDACVSLQDRFGLNVNVLLLAAYVGAVRGERLTPDRIDAARKHVDDWDREIVRPLRGVRRLLKSGPAPAPSPQTDEVRGAVAKAELDAELIELDLLDRWASQLDAPDRRPSMKLVLAALQTVLSSYSAERLDDAAHRALAVIADAAIRQSEATA